MDFQSANEAELEGVPDSDVLAIAAEQDRILVTHDRQTMPQHFGEFVMSGRSSPGIFLVSPRVQSAPLLFAARHTGISSAIPFHAATEFL
jgi:hypothetical protein